ncbi:MAG: HEAT repeat domain-containing protein, partial [Chromatiales bacterium]
LGLLVLASGLMPWNGVVIASPDLPPGAPVDARPFGAVDIELHEGMVTVKVARASWTDVLTEFARKTGVRFHYAAAAPGVVTTSCIRMTIARALECLLGDDAALVLRYPTERSGARPDPLPTEVWVLGQPGNDGERNRMATQSPSPRAGSAREAATTGQDDFAAIMEMTASVDPDTRERALGRLAVSENQTDPAAQAVFRAALADADGSVRAQAVYALARGGAPQSVHVLRDALRDVDVSVRLMAVDSAGADEPGTALLHEALADEDETVRVAAAIKLNQTMKLVQTGHAAASAHN